LVSDWLFCAARGATVELVDRNDPSDVAKDYGGTAHVCDVSERAAVLGLAQRVGAVDGLVLAAGIQPYDSWETSNWAENWQNVMAINTFGMATVAEAFFGTMTTRGGRIVLLGSQSGRNGGTFSGPHYVFTKGGVHAFCRWLARKGAAHNVLVNAVAPGPVDTPFIAASPLIQPPCRWDVSVRPRRSPVRSLSCSRRRQATSRASCSTSMAA
jgi:3-oxoacyl-[acyl-carrier protein] reductase